MDDLCAALPIRAQSISGTEQEHRNSPRIYLFAWIDVCARESHIRQPFRVLRNYDDAPFSIRVVHNIVSDLVRNRFNFLCAATVFRSYTCYMHYFPTHHMKIEQPGRFSSMPNCREFSFEHLMFQLVFSCVFLRFYWFHSFALHSAQTNRYWQVAFTGMACEKCLCIFSTNSIGVVASFVVRRRLWFSQFVFDALRFMHSTSKILLHIIYF